MQVPTEQAVLLGTNRRYMCFLLDLVERKTAEHASHTTEAQNNNSHITLKFALSALRNLTGSGRRVVMMSESETRSSGYSSSGKMQTV